MSHATDPDDLDDEAPPTQLEPTLTFLGCDADEPCDCGGQGNGLDGFHYPGAMGCLQVAP